MNNNLTLSHFIMAILVTLVWGTNFVVIHIGLLSFPPFLFAGLRFLLVFFPLCLFLKRPNVPLINIAAYGFLVGAGQFGLLFTAMKLGLAPGLASLVMQVQVFFTIGLAVILSKEKIAGFQIFALLLSASGIILIALKGGGETSVFALCLALIGAFGWASSNIIIRKSPNVNMLSYVVWGGLFAFPPLLLVSYIFEGKDLIIHSIENAPINAWLALVWQSVGNSLFDYAVWGFLLGKYKAGSIAPLSLLVPVFGIGAAIIFLQEPLPMWKIIASILILSGLAINMFWPKIITSLQFKKA